MMRDPLRDVLNGVPGVRLAVVFGSTSTDTAGRHSDIDIGVSMDDGGDRLPTLRVALERAAGRRVDLVSLDVAPPLLRFEIARSGIVMLERERDAWAEFRAHAMIDWWDWAPTARMMHETMMTRLREEARRGAP